MNFLYVKDFESYRTTACKCMHLFRRGHLPVTWQTWRSYHWMPPYPKTPC